MVKKPLRSALKEKFENECLSEIEISSLESISVESSERLNHSNKKFITWGAIAASVLLAIALTTQTYFFNSPNHALQNRIVREVLTNHLKITSLDIETSSINEIRQYFDRLNFAPYLSSQLKGIGLKLVGGRYCTLQGVIASHLRFLDHSGNIVTYYQAHYDQTHFGEIANVSLGEKPKIVYDHGYAMTIWREGNVVSVLARAKS